ncbi:MAG: hypothetical protein ACOX7X_11160 [Methanosarcina flavescens]|jgi:hypothetical protein|uniref:Uncharacterized protein n=1 Tax=Methanosarcina flavescens TaxID=1715806 RepID=A0A660HRR5_9EURY|nr:hypothetical protein [Methanosarcina flavescens]AYK14756.1 hypothetical protein AOB57_005755 [Methanosarcina flavescens]NLK33381.1 hypothetical protein [Methanosarcina flavescens]
MTGEPKKPPRTTAMKILCNMVLIPNLNDEVEYFTVDSKGYPAPKKTEYANREATIIVGHKERSYLVVTPEDRVFTGAFRSNGRLSSVGQELEGKELTVIIHMPE